MFEGGGAGLQVGGAVGAVGNEAGNLRGNGSGIETIPRRQRIRETEQVHQVFHLGVVREGERGNGKAGGKDQGVQAHGDNGLHPPCDAEQNVRGIRALNHRKRVGIARPLRDIESKSNIFPGVHGQENDLRARLSFQFGEQADVLFQWG